MININQLNFGYKKKETLFNELDLQLVQGNIVGLLGKNGAGKTTLLKIISGLRFQRTGQCQVMGYDAEKRNPELLREVYFLPEEFYVPAITIAQYVSLNAPFFPNFDKKQFDELVLEFDLPIKNKLTAFSYGQKKKFLIAFGLATNCKLFLLDEPTNGLDIPSKSQFRKILTSSISPDRTFIISTHQVRDMDKLIDPIVILDNGRVIFNHDINKITDTLFMQIQNDEPDKNDVIHFEKTIGGYMTVKENSGQEQSLIDLETLFNSVIGAPQKMDELFGNGRSDKNE